MTTDNLKFLSVNWNLTA